MTTIPFIKYSKVWLTISSITILVSLSFLLMWGLKPGIDFTGGSLMELNFSGERPAASGVTKVLEDLDYKSNVVQNSGEESLIIRTSFMSEEKHQELLNEIRSKYQTDENKIREERFETIGASISQQLRSRAMWAILFVSLGIIFYVGYAFRKVSRPVASWKYGLLAIVALLHDLLVVIGVFALLGHFYGLEVDTAFVVALLTVLGYSVNDTIVVYDRTRENLLRRNNEEFGEVVNLGLNQTLSRSINTTITTLFPLTALYFLGGATIHNFILALLIGVASGAYSSIFIASPLLVMVEKWQRRR